MDFCFIIELQTLNRFETLLQERLHTKWVFSLRKNFEQLRIRQEEESREETSLRLQVLIQTFLHLFKLSVSAVHDVM